MKTEKNPKGAGRKPMYAEKTTTLSKRVPLSIKEDLMDYIRKECEKLEVPSISKKVDKAISDGSMELRDKLNDIMK